MYFSFFKSVNDVIKIKKEEETITEIKKIFCIKNKGITYKIKDKINVFRFPKKTPIVFVPDFLSQLISLSVEIA